MDSWPFAYSTRSSSHVPDAVLEAQRDILDADVSSRPPLRVDDREHADSRYVGKQLSSLAPRWLHINGPNPCLMSTKNRGTGQFLGFSNNFRPISIPILKFMTLPQSMQTSLDRTPFGREHFLRQLLSQVQSHELDIEVALETIQPLLNRFVPSASESDPVPIHTIEDDTAHEQSNMGRTRNGASFGLDRSKPRFFPWEDSAADSGYISDPGPFEDSNDEERGHASLHDIPLHNARPAPQFSDAVFRIQSKTRAALAAAAQRRHALSNSHHQPTSAMSSSQSLARGFRILLSSLSLVEDHEEGVDSDDEDVDDIDDSSVYHSTNMSRAPSSTTKEEDLQSSHLSLSSPGTQSPLESSVFSHSTSSEMNIAAALLSSPESQEITDNVTIAFRGFIDSRLGSRQHAGSGNSHKSMGPPVASDGSSNGYRSSGYRNNFASSKRSQQSNDDDGEGSSGRAPGDGNPSSKRQRTDVEEKPKIACPFMKNSPTEFSTWRTCVGPGFDGMNRMKEHLKRRHFKENTCQRCGVRFRSSRTLQEHLREPVPCSLRDAFLENGFMTSLQWDEIHGKRSRCSIVEKWKEIYLILFPNTKEDDIPSPYFESSEMKEHLAATFDPGEYEVYLKQHLPSRVLLRLKEEFDIFSDRVKEKLVTIVQEESSDTLKAFVLQRGGQFKTPDEPPLSFAEQSFLDTNFLENMDLCDLNDQFNYNVAFDGYGWPNPNIKGKGPADSTYGSMF